MMDSLKIVMWLVVMTICCMRCAVSNAKDISNITVTMTSDCVNYGLVDNISLRVRIENQGPSPIVMYGKIGWGELGGLTLKIARANGEVVQPESLDADMIIPSTLHDRSYYVTIFRSQFIGISRVERVTELFPDAGKYKVWVEYMSPVPRDSSLVRHSFWSMESGRVISNALILSVGEGASCKCEQKRD